MLAQGVRRLSLRAWASLASDSEDTVESLKNIEIRCDGTTQLRPCARIQQAFQNVWTDAKQEIFALKSALSQKAPEMRAKLQKGESAKKTLVFADPVETVEDLHRIIDAEASLFFTGKS